MTSHITLHHAANKDMMFHPLHLSPGLNWITWIQHVAVTGYK